MATLSVWKFDDADGAQRALDTLERLEKENLLELYDGAVVSWQLGDKKPKTKQMRSTAGAGALGGSFWGLLFGLIFFVPLIGMALGAAFGAMSGALADVGIDDDFIKQVRTEVVPGTSALFVMTANAVVDKVKDAFRDQPQPQLMFTNLSEEQDRALRSVFVDA